MNFKISDESESFQRFEDELKEYLKNEFKLEEEEEEKKIMNGRIMTKKVVSNGMKLKREDEIRMDKENWIKEEMRFEEEKMSLENEQRTEDEQNSDWEEDR